MRLAVKFGYDGSVFHGSQRQSDDDPLSVEGRIVSAMRKVGAIPPEGDPPVRISSRTDAGVSALGNVLSVDTDMAPSDLLPALNANLDSVWCLGSAVMRDAQNVRWANARWYRFHLLPGTRISVPDLNDALSLFVGEHDFVHLSRRDEEKNTVIVMERSSASDLSGSGDLIAVDLIGSRFLWNQVRRMVGASLRIVSGEISREDMAALLKGGRLSGRLRDVRDRIPTLPPTGLILMDVMYKDLEFTPEHRALDLACERYEDRLWRSTMSVMLGGALRSMRDTSG
jgi:tRNA pseudouridine38-40 synthase